MFDVKSVDEVFEIISRNFSGYKVENETVHIKEAAGRIAAEGITACENIPPFHRSMVDGYAVISSDTFGASDSMPAQLKLAGEVFMGQKPGFVLARGQSAYVPTGGELPGNADSVVMIEYTEDYNDGFIYINKASAPGNHIVFAGDDMRSGDVVLRQGALLRPQDTGVLAAAGYSSVSVKKRLKVGIISTGDEIVDVDQKPEGSKVRDINSYTLYSGIVEYGGEPVLYGIINDDYEKLRATVEMAVNECDVVLVSGGSSVGTRDHTFKVIDSMGDPGILVHGIAVKPGKPTILGKVKGKAVFGLPGHPVSAYMIFKIFVCKLFDVICNRNQEIEKYTTARLSCNYPSNNGREEFLPVRLEYVNGTAVVHPVFGKSGLITFLASADGYVHIPRGCEGLSKGREVNIILF